MFKKHVFGIFWNENCFKNTWTVECWNIVRAFPL